MEQRWGNISKFQLFLSKFTYSQFFAHSAYSRPFLCYSLLGLNIYTLLIRKKLGSFRRQMTKLWQIYAKLNVDNRNKKHKFQCFANTIQCIKDKLLPLVGPTQNRWYSGNWKWLAIYHPKNSGSSPLRLLTASESSWSHVTIKTTGKISWFVSGKFSGTRYLMISMYSFKPHQEYVAKPKSQSWLSLVRSEINL